MEQAPFLLVQCSKHLQQQCHKIGRRGSSLTASCLYVAAVLFLLAISICQHKLTWWYRHTRQVVKCMCSSQLWGRPYTAAAAGLP